MPLYHLIHQLLIVFDGMPEEFRRVQLKWIRDFPLLPDEEIRQMAREYLILHRFLLMPNSSVAALLWITCKKGFGFSAISADAAIEATMLVINLQQVDSSGKCAIIHYCRTSMTANDPSIGSKIKLFCSLSEDMIVQFDTRFYIDVLNKRGPALHQDRIRVLQLFLAISDDRKTADDLLNRGELGPELNSAVEAAKRRRATEPRTVPELLKAFKRPDTPLPPIHLFPFDGTPLFPLSDTDQDRLSECAQAIETSPPIGKSALAAMGREYASQFKQSHSISSLAWLISVIRSGVREMNGKTPYMVQCLSVCSLMLHFVENRPGLKGRIAQVATGEGKSIIVAILALATSLMGHFVDVITSTQYLARRDWAEFAGLFSAFRISSSTIASDHPDFSGAILYGTNTDFEFAFLRDGISPHKSMRSFPVDESSRIHRPSDVAIVDESDNLFLDAASNSARIAYTSEQHFEWVYRPIYEIVSFGLGFPSMVRKYLEEFDGGIHRDEVLTLTDEMLWMWISSALRARNHLVLGGDYVKSGGIIEIVDAANTGRISHSSRWSNGIHEFVEVKEGLRVGNQSTTIASIGHLGIFH
jgi:hypothetical protein